LKITARPYKRITGNVHVLAEVEIEPKTLLAAGADAINFTVISNHLSLGGQHRLTVTLSRQEVEALSRAAATAGLEKRIAQLEKEIAKLKGADSKV
jgi:hypothetical protein